MQVVEELLSLLTLWNKHQSSRGMENAHIFEQYVQRFCISPTWDLFWTPALGGEAIFALGDAWGVALGERSPIFTASALCFRRSFLESLEACEATHYWSPKRKNNRRIWSIHPFKLHQSLVVKSHSLCLLGKQPPTCLQGQPFLLLQEPSWHLVLLVLALAIFHMQQAILALKARYQLHTKPCEFKKELSLSLLISRWTSKTTLSLSPSDVVVTSDFAVAFCMTLLTFQGCDLDFCPEWHTRNSQEMVQNWETYQYIKFRAASQCP